MQLRQSMRRAARMRLALAGASGSGKTYSSLLIAYGMTGDWSRVAVIDSENCSADLYAHLGGYQESRSAENNFKKPISGYTDEGKFSETSGTNG